MTWPNVDDPDLIAFLRDDVPYMMRTCFPEDELVQAVLDDMRDAAIGTLVIETDRVGNMCWFVMLNLRGVEVANRAWGVDGAPPGCKRKRMPTRDINVEQAIVAPIRRL